MFGAKLLDHFEHPRNAGELVAATARVEVSNPVCGDVLRLAAVVEGGVVREIRFLCRGCTAAIACASALTELVLGRGIGAVGEIAADKIADAVGGLPEASFHAAQLASDALRALQENMRGKGEEGRNG
jgi:nitrogen fixation protein NifU and related proteins